MPNGDHRQDPPGPSGEDSSSREEPRAPEPLLREPAAPQPILGDKPSSSPIFTDPVREPPVRSEPDRPGTEAGDQAGTAEQRRPSSGVVAPEREAAPEPKPDTQVPQWVAALWGAGDVRALADRADRLARILLCAGIFLVPVVFDPRTNDAFNLLKVTTLWTFVVLAAGAWVFSNRLDGRRLIPRSRLITVATALLGVAGFSTMLGPNRTLSFHGLYHRYEGLASIALYVGLLIVLVGLYRRRPRALSEITVAVGAAGGVVGTYVLLQRLGLDPFTWQELGGGAPTFPIGNLGNSSFTASYMGITVPFVLYLVLSSRHAVVRAAWSGVGVLVLLGLLATQGRAGLLAAVVGVLALFLFSSRVKAAVKLGAVGIVLLLLGLMPVVFGDPTDRADEGLFRRGTASYRTEVWNASWDMTMSRPLLGWGPESYFGQYGSFRTAEDARRLGLSLTDKPHNIFFGWSTSTGLIGFGIYVLLLGSALVLVAGARTRDRSRRLLLAVFAAGLVSYLVQGLYSIDVPPLAFMGWVALAGIAAMAAWAKNEDSAEDEEADASGDNKGLARAWRNRPWVLAAAVAAVSVLLVALGSGPVRADYQIRSAQNRAPLGWSADVMNMYQRAIALNPREAAYRGLAGSYLESVSDDAQAPFTRATALRRAAEFYEEAVALQPRNVYFMINAARVYAVLGSGDERFFSEADEWLARVIEIDPLNPQARDLHVDLLHQWSEQADDPEVAAELRQRSQAQEQAAQALREGRILR